MVLAAMEPLRRLRRLSKSDYFILAKFLGPLTVTTVAVDLGEQVLEPTPKNAVWHEVASLSAEGEGKIVQLPLPSAMFLYQNKTCFSLPVLSQPK